MYRTLCTTVAVAMALMSVLAQITYAQGAQPSAVACDNYARNYANNTSRQGQVLKGGAVGSLAGLGIGAIFGGAGVGAAVGAVGGMLGGGAKRQGVAQQMYGAAYQDCMAGKIR
jgi:hypothetical protein